MKNQEEIKAAQAKLEAMRIIQILVETSEGKYNEPLALGLDIVWVTGLIRYINDLAKNPASRESILKIAEAIPPEAWLELRTNLRKFLGIE